MKLYTEEEVRTVLNAVSKLDKPLSVDEIIDFIIPIELPSDEEIENSAKKLVMSYHLENRCFQLGAKWIKEQITKTK